MVYRVCFISTWLISRNTKGTKGVPEENLCEKEKRGGRSKLNFQQYNIFRKGKAVYLVHPLTGTFNQQISMRLSWSHCTCLRDC